MQSSFDQKFSQAYRQTYCPAPAARVPKWLRALWCWF